MSDNTVIADASRAGATSTLPSAILQLATSRGLVLVISLVTAPILGRLFPPHAYGTLGVITTACTILAGFASLCYVFAIPLASSLDERRDVVVVCLILGVTTTVIVGVAAFLGSDALGAAFHEPDVAKYAVFIPLLFLSGAAQSLFNMTLNCQRRFMAISTRNVLEAVVTRTVQLTACFLGGAGSPLVLIIGSLCGSYSASMFAGVRSFRDITRAATTPLRWRNLRAVAWKHRKFPLVLLWSQTLNTISIGLPTMILAIRFSISTVGLYGMAYTMVNLPIQLFTASASQVFFVEAADHIAHGRSAVPTTQQLIRTLAGLTSFPLMVVLALGPLVFETFLGPRWREAGVYAQILTPWMAGVAFGSPLSAVLNIVDRQGEAFLWNVVGLVARAASLFWGALFWGVRGTLAFFAIVSAIVAALMIVRCLLLLHVRCRSAIATIVRSYLEPLALLAPSALLYWSAGAKTLSLVALGFACLGYLVLLHLRYPRVLQTVRVRLISPWLRHNN